MSINKQTFRTRTLTSLIFVLVMLAGLLINQWSFIVLFSIIMIGCLVEFNKVIIKINPGKYFLLLPLALVYIVLPILLLTDLALNADKYIKGIAEATHNDNYSALLPCAIIISLWINDTMAYLVGSMIGKTPFSKISPKKTWEGTIGGSVLCIVSMAVFGPVISTGKLISWQQWICIAAICSVFGTLGDLLESKLKRMANIKDTGAILPGHGGFLDRFDSLLGSTTFVWIYVKLFFNV